MKVDALAENLPIRSLSLHLCVREWILKRTDSVKGGDERRWASDLVKTRLSCVNYLWDEHVCCPVEDFDRAGRLTGHHNIWRLTLLLEGNLSILWKVKVSNRIFWLNFGCKGEIIHQLTCVPMLIIVWVEACREGKCVITTKNFESCQDREPQFRLLSWLQVSKLGNHNLVPLLLSLDQDSRFSACYSICELLVGSQFIHDLCLDQFSIKCDFKTG